MRVCETVIKENRKKTLINASRKQYIKKWKPNE